jgi:uncharacterized membrane protein
MSDESKERENKVDIFLSDVEEALSKRLKSYRTWIHIIYVLYILALFNGITAIIGVIIAYILRAQLPPNEEIFRDQFTWQIRTFWGAFILSILAFILFFTIIIPIILLIIIVIWIVYRTVKGWIALANNQRLYSE